MTTTTRAMLPAAAALTASTGATVGERDDSSRRDPLGLGELARGVENLHAGRTALDHVADRRDRYAVALKLDRQLVGGTRGRSRVQDGDRDRREQRADLLGGPMLRGGAVSASGRKDARTAATAATVTSAASTPAGVRSRERRYVRRLFGPVGRSGAADVAESRPGDRERRAGSRPPEPAAAIGDRGVEARQPRSELRVRRRS